MWFAKSINSVLSEFRVDQASGLSESDAKARLVKYGSNKLQGKKTRNIFRMFIAQLQDWLIYVLLVAVVITLFMGEFTDATIIVLVIITNAVLGLIQEVRAGKAIEALQGMSVPKALVRRDGVVEEVDSERIVPGDILILEAGRFIAADIRLIESVNLQIDESALTGESVPSDKDASVISDDPNMPLGDRTNSSFMSSLVTRGRGLGVVVETGMNSEVGKIANLIITGKKSKTPLEIRLNSLGKTLGLLAIGICLLIFIITMLQGRNIADMFLMSVSLAVAAIPEGLAAIVAVVLSIGVTSMSKKNAIIRKLPAVETLGSVNIICSDKTGTLTQNKMTVTTYFNLEGRGYMERGKNNAVSDDIRLLAKAMILCSDATLENGHGTGDPTEIALLVFGDDLGMDRKTLNRENHRVGELSFDSGRKLMSTLHVEHENFTVYTKGAIGNLLKISTHILKNGEVVPLNESYRNQILNAAENMANGALRTLGVAYKPADSPDESSQTEKNLIFAGFVGMIDPPRPEVKLSIQLAKTAGITTIMITGDHMTEKDFIDRIAGYRVFARVSPEHKVKIVGALKSLGNVVSMTGDGVNDAPSLYAADIGIAMGITGTDVARGASDMILTDDNFATIVSAIEQGRNIYNNIKKSVVFLLTCNLGEVISVLVTLLIGWEAPLIATQLLWINLLTDSFPAVALGMGPGNPDIMREKPRNAKESFFSGGATIHMILGGSLIGALTIAAFWFGYYEHGYSPFDHSAPKTTVEYARTMAFMVLVVCQLFYSLALRNSSKSIFRIGIFSNKYLTGAILLGVLLQLIVIGIPAVQSAFHLQMLDLRGWGIVIFLGLIPLSLDEFIKIFIRLHHKKIKTATP
ncbi:MAG: cation-translocating P-type ATPase [Bacteroidetes bacterium]|nr:cation-translocating P-type ATPase [Bacteroidota bacterium]